ncbi:acyltransferase [Polynucleobacter sp. JS-Mosq-20-D10]|uniref:acyltransferase family protein n=1 Tax=Polynucleobacter sp. JS-Mosq-20-D10 TaxID=2576922 RepID=UPI001BFDEF56|nr:acyltransferase family protein [Polynucleobacter sp. JS-Mosq-20-D10]QWE00418.1 acyltransferase [Polynucleobacter sp. JS-Mosq-20-D10]
MYLKYHSINYRKDIDGLRALAVLSTIAYHAFPNLVSGGFVGVDIFFVISGFLITKIILENLESNSFSFAEFYFRRIRRIFPALFLILVTCYAFGWFALYASEFKGVGEHIAASAGFFQNFILLNEIAYFERSVDTKPLIHLWSLSIEEQFYLLWPAIIWILYKARINLLGAVLILILISFSINIYNIKFDPITTFYSPLSRFWELLVGALWACISLRNSQEARQFSQAALNVFSWVGLILINIAIFWISGKNSFPGWWALLPTVGAVLLISANSEASINRVFLSNNVMVWLGVISYPLYLWHWILLSFGQIISAGKLSDFHKIALILVAIGLAYLTHRYWERLFRYQGKKVAVLLIALMTSIGYQGWSVYVRDGLDFRHKYVLDLHGGRPPHSDKACLQEFVGYQPTFCRLSYVGKNIETVLIGDSIAHNHFSGLERYYSNIGKSFAMVGWPGTQPFLKKTEAENYSLETGHKMNQLIIGLAHDQSVKTVILGFRETAINSLEKVQLERTIKFLRDNGKQAILISPPPHLSFEPIECTGMPPFRPTLNKECIQLAKDINAQYFIARTELIKIAENSNVKLFDTYQQICIQDKCQLRIEGGLLYRNKGYLSIAGSEKIFEKFTE